MKNGSWTEIKIADLFASMSTGDWGQSPTLSSSVPVVRSTNFRNNGFLDLTDVVYRAISKERLSSRTINKGDILFEKSGGGPMQPAGRIAYSETDFQGTASNFIEIGKVKSNYDNKFVFYLLHSLYLNGLVLKYQQQTTGIINFKIKEYFKEVVKVPSEKKEQAKIAEILATIDRAIAQTEALIAKHQRIKTGLMQDLLTRGIDEHGQLRDPSTHRFKSTPLGMIPEEWEVSSIEGFVTSGDGVKPGPFGSSLKKEFYSKNGYRVYGQEQVIAGTLKIGDYYIPKELYERLSMFSVQENDILISLVGTTGKVLIVKPPFSPGIINPRLIRLRPNLRNNDVQFMSYLMTSQIVKSQFENIAQTGTMAVLSGKSFRQLTLPKPQKEEQKRISDILLLADSKITNSEIYLGKLRGIKSGLMQDLLSGRVSVKMLMEGEKQ